MKAVRSLIQIRLTKRSGSFNTYASSMGENRNIAKKRQKTPEGHSIAKKKNLDNAIVKTKNKNPNQLSNTI